MTAEPSAPAPIHEGQRAPMREDPRARHTGVRRRKGTTHDDFHIDPSDIPDGMSLNWKTDDVAGQPQSATMQTHLENDWLPVDSNSPTFRKYATNGSGTIKRGGMVLMERPKELTEEAFTELRQTAEVNRRGAEEAVGITGDGEGPRSAELKSGYAPVRSPASLPAHLQSKFSVPK